MLNCAKVRTSNKNMKSKTKVETNQNVTSAYGSLGLSNFADLERTTKSPYVIDQLKIRDTNLHSQPADLQYYDLLLSSFNEPRTINLPDHLSGRKWKQSNTVVVHWGTKYNEYCCQSSGTFGVATIQKTKIDPSKYQTSINTIAKFPIKFTARNLKYATYSEEVLGGVAFTGSIVPFTKPGYTCQTRHSAWKTSSKGDMTNSVVGVISNIKCGVVSLDGIYTKIRDAAGDVHLAITLDPGITDDSVVCEESVYENYGGKSVDNRFGPLSKLKINTTVINTLAGSLSVLPTMHQTPKERRLYYKDVFQAMVDTKTKHDLIFQSLQAGLRKTVRIFKNCLKTDVRSIHPFAGVTMDVFHSLPQTTNWAHIPQNVKSNKRSTFWQTLLVSEMSNETTEVTNIKNVHFAKEFGLTDVLKEGSKVLSVSQNFLLRFVGLDGKINMDAGNSLGLYEEVLPFDVLLGQGNDSFSVRRAPMFVINRLNQLQCHLGWQLYEDIGNTMHRVLTERAWAAKEQVNAKDLNNIMTNRLPIQLEAIIKPFLSDDDGKVLYAMSHGNMSLPFEEAKPINTTLSKCIKAIVTDNVILNVKYDKLCKSQLEKIFKIYESKRHGMMTTDTDIRFTVLKNRRKTVTGLAFNKVRKIEMKSLLFSFFKEVAQMWFNLHNEYMLEHGFADVTFFHNNTPIQSVFDDPIDNDSTPLLQKMQQFGILGLSSWYTMANIFLMLTNGNNDDDDDDDDDDDYEHNDMTDMMMHLWMNDKTTLNSGKQTLGFLMDEILYQYKTNVIVLSLSSDKATSVFAVDTLLGQLRAQKLMRTKNRTNLFHDWLLAVDGVWEVNHSDSCLTSLLSEPGFNSRYKRNPNVPKGEALCPSNHHYRLQKDLSEFVMSNGGFILKCGITLRDQRKESAEHYMVGEPLRIESGEVVQAFQKFGRWLPFTVDLPRYLDQKLGDLSDVTMLNTFSFDRTRKDNQGKYHFRAPHEYSFLVGESVANAREPTDPNMLNGYRLEIRSKAYPLNGSQFVLDGVSCLMTHYDKVCKYEADLRNEILQRQDHAQHFSGTSHDAVLTKQEHLRLLQISRTKTIMRCALKELGSALPTHSLNKGVPLHSNEEFTLEYEKKEPRKPAAEYTLEWHIGNSYRGQSSYFGKECCVPTVYNNPQDPRNTPIGVGEYTLWLVMDCSKNHFKYINGNKRPFTVIKGQFKNYETALNTYKKKPTVLNKNNIETRIEDINRQLLAHYATVRNANTRFTTTLNFYELVMRHLDGVEQRRKKDGDDVVFDHFVKVPDSNTMDFNSAPSFCLMRICTVNVTKSDVDSDDDNEICSNSSSELFENEGLRSDLVTTIAELEKLPTFQNETFVGAHSHVLERLRSTPWMQNLELSGLKYSTLHKRFCTPSNLPVIIVDNARDNSMSVRKGHAGAYEMVFLHPLSESARKMTKEGLPSFIQKEHVDRHINDLGVHVMFSYFSSTGFQTTPLTRYYRPISNVIKTVLLSLTGAVLGEDYVSGLFESTDADKNISLILEQFANYAITTLMTKRMEYLASVRNGFGQQLTMMSRGRHCGRTGYLPFLMRSLDNLDHFNITSALTNWMSKLPKVNTNDGSLAPIDDKPSLWRKQLANLHYFLLDVMMDRRFQKAKGPKKYLNDLLGSPVEKFGLQYKILWKLNIVCKDTITGHRYSQSNYSNMRYLHLTQPLLMSLKLRHVPSGSRIGMETGDVLDYVTNILAQHIVYHAINTVTFHIPSGQSKVDSIFACDFPAFEVLFRLHGCFSKMRETYSETHQRELKEDKDVLHTYMSIRNEEQATSWAERFPSEDPILEFKSALVEKLKTHLLYLDSTLAEGGYDSGLQYLEDVEDDWSLLFVDYIRFAKLVSLQGNPHRDSPVNPAHYNSLALITKNYFLATLMGKCECILLKMYETINKVACNRNFLMAIRKRRDPLVQTLTRRFEYWKNMTMSVHLSSPVQTMTLFELCETIHHVHVEERQMTCTGLDRYRRALSRIGISSSANLCECTVSSLLYDLCAKRREASIVLCNAGNALGEKQPAWTRLLQDLYSWRATIQAPNVTNEEIFGGFGELQQLLHDMLPEGQFTKYKIMRVFQSLFVNPAGYMGGEVDPRDIAKDLFVGSKDCHVHHYDNVSFNKSSVGGNMELYALKEWLKTVYLPAVLDQRWYDMTSQDEPSEKRQHVKVMVKSWQSKMTTHL